MSHRPPKPPNPLETCDNIEAIRAALQAARVVAWEWDPLADRVVHSENCDDVLGIPGDTSFTRAEDFFGLVHPDDVLSARELLDGTVARCEPHVAVVRIVRPDNGEIRWIENHANVLTTDDGRLTKLAGVAFDVTEREEAKLEKKRLEQRIESTQQNLEAMVEILPIGFAIAHDPECKRITLNPVLRELFGVDRGANISLTGDQSLTSSYAVLQYGRLLTPGEMPLQRAARGEQVVREQVELLFADGRKYHLVGSASPLRDAEGTPYGAIGAFLDLTEWIEDRKQRDELLVSEQRLRREVQAAGQAKDRFIATLSHELRTPLTPVLLTSAELESYPGLPEESGNRLR